MFEPKRAARTSEEWWASIKDRPEKVAEWLAKQYHGEVTAAERIQKFLDMYQDEITAKNRVTLRCIIAQEKLHAEWVGELLKTRGIEPEVMEGKETPYWDETLSGIKGFVTGCAVAAHAEQMRLERIMVIAKDETCPSDLSDTFTLILVDEQFHAKAFEEMATPEAMEATQESHELGRSALGLHP